MPKIEIVEQEDRFGNITEIVNIENEDGSVTSMTKAYWDKLEAQKELGGTL